MQRAEKSIRVKASVGAVYDYWRNFEHFPSFMTNVEEVTLLDPQGRRSHWKLKGPVGTAVEFDATITQDEPNRSIGWKSTGGTMGSSGNVTFVQTDFNTEVHVIMQWYDPPGKAIGEAASRLLQNPEGMLHHDLERFKELIEMHASTMPAQTPGQPEPLSGSR